MRGDAVWEDTEKRVKIILAPTCTILPSFAQRKGVVAGQEIKVTWLDTLLASVLGGEQIQVIRLIWKKLQGVD
jgi:hypothetical protein